MIKTLTNLLKQDKEKFVVPKGVQDCIPITAIYDDGIFRVGKDKYSKSFKFTDINFAVASREDKEAMFLEYSELLNSLDSGATTKLTINNRRLNRLDFEKTILIPETGDDSLCLRHKSGMFQKRAVPLLHVRQLRRPGCKLLRCVIHSVDRMDRIIKELPQQRTVFRSVPSQPDLHSAIPLSAFLSFFPKQRDSNSFLFLFVCIIYILASNSLIELTNPSMFMFSTSSFLNNPQHVPTYL